MIKEQWYAILDARQLPVRRPIGVTRFGEKLVLWRPAAGQVACIADKCCHRGAALCGGRLVGGRVQCPFHGFEYDPSGQVAFIPANGRASAVAGNYKVRGYTARQAHGFIWVWYGAMETAPADIPFFEELDEGFSYGQIHENWAVHYTRAIENQLDVVHLPFVHRTTIGRGNKALVNGPVVTWQGDRMTYYVENTVDVGAKPKKASEMTDYLRLYSLQLQMPNIWQNRVSDKLRIMAAFAPVDDQNTMIYLRFYQRFVRVPVLRQLVNALGDLADRVVLHQDRRVVLTQRPVRSELSMGENLVPGDAPVIAFRTRRAALQAKADGR